MGVYYEKEFVFCFRVRSLYASGELRVRVRHSSRAADTGSLLWWGNLTVHTDVPFDLVETVALDVNGTAVDVSLFADCYGNVVAQCSKEVAKEAVGDFDGKTTTITVTLTVNGDSASEDIRVKK